jgi:hypothetical protein
MPEPACVGHDTWMHSTKHRHLVTDTGWEASQPDAKQTFPHTPLLCHPLHSKLMSLKAG